MYIYTRILVEVVPATDSTVGKYSQTTMQTHPEACTEVFTRIKVRSHRQYVSLLFLKQALHLSLLRLSVTIGKPQ